MTFYQIVWFIFYMDEWSLYNKKLCFLLIHNSWKMEIEMFQPLNHVGVNLKTQFLIKSSYYIVPIVPLPP